MRRRRIPATGERATETNWLVSGSTNDAGWGKDVETILRALVPQLVDSAKVLSVTSGNNNEVRTIIGLGLPTSEDQITKYDWVDFQGGGNVGDPPDVNGVTIGSLLGVNGFGGMCFGNWDFDATGTVAGDVWAFLVFTSGAVLFLAVITIV